MANITNQTRFDDIGVQDADGLYDYAYRGFNYDIKVGSQIFKVRIYDGEPDVARVIGPIDARTRAEAAELIEFIKATLGCGRAEF